MSQHNPDLQPPAVPHPNEAIQPHSADFVETPDVAPISGEKESLPYWLYLICGFALFMAGSSFVGFGTFGQGLLDQGPGGPVLASGPTIAAPASDDPMAQGAKLYNNNCASCHQKTGEGSPGKYPPMVGSEYVIGSKERLAAILLHGVSGSLTVSGGAYGSEQMPAWATNFTDSKMAAIMTYLRGSWGNKANDVKPEEVSAARTKFNAKTGTYSEAELLKIAPNGPDPSDKKS